MAKAYGPEGELDIAQMEKRRSRARRGEGEKLRTEIVDAAEGLLLERGAQSAVSIRDIAHAVGVTPPAIYLHFRNKEDLFLAVGERSFVAFGERIRLALRETSDPIDRVRRTGRAYVEFGLEHPEQYRVMMMTKTDFDPLEHPLEEMFGMQVFYQLVTATKQCIDDGVFRPMEPMMGAIILWSVVHGLISLFINHAKFPWPDRDALIEEVLETGISGLRS